MFVMITKSRWAVSWMLIVSLLFVSCLRLRSRPPVEEEEPPVAENEEIIARPVVQPAAPTSEYRLGYGDIIEIMFFYNPDLDQTLTVRPDGRITLPRLGDILVAGMTPTQLDELITLRYAEIIREPEITVIVREFGEQVVYVLGEVNDPGGYPLNPNGTTVLSAIAMAEGFKVTAKLSSVILIEQDSQGIPMASRLNLTRAVSGGKRADDPFLRGNEIVYVPSTFISQLNQFMDQFFTKMAPPFDFYLKGYDAINPERRWRSQ
jgi:protein involved in polysaccharide export with SLBB domain